MIDVHATLVLSERGRKAKTIDEKQKLTLASPFKLSPHIHLSITVKTNENILSNRITWGLYIYIYIYMYIIYKCVANTIIVTIIIHNYRNVQIVLSHLAS